MCGLIALINDNGGVSKDTLTEMCKVIAHRGPDGEGLEIFEGGRVGFGHRRLSIIDVTEGGHQPMKGADGRYWITYNGEIYNHLELRAELENLDHAFQSHSDTEVLLAAWKEWGEECLDRLNGMFAFVLYDTRTDSTIAVRDRFGVKPLYGWQAPDGTVAFASEIKAFTKMPGWRAVLNGQMAYDFLAWGLSDHTNQTLFQDVFQVAPGCLIEVKAGKMKPRIWFTPTPDAAVPKDFDEASKTFKEKFMDSVKLRLRADVPVGTALSGGLDSSSIVCAVHDLRNGDDGRNAFSARAKDADFDEGPFMEIVAKQTGVDHHMTWPDADGFLSDLEQMIWHHDEPFGSASIYAEWKVFEKVAETDVKVTLDGHGADETLAGYTAFVGPLLGSLSLSGIMREWKAQRDLHKRSTLWLISMLVDDKAPNWLRSILRRLTGRTHATPAWLDVNVLKAKSQDPFEASQGRGHGMLGLSLAQLCATSLPMQLKWADRDSMAHSIESREPFLDPNLVSYILGLPDDFKLDHAISKRVLRSGLGDMLPTEIVNRHDKMGFVTPESLWVTRDRPDAFEALVTQSVEAAKGILTPAALNEARAMTAGKIPFHTRLIRMITFGVWMKRFKVELQ